MPAFFILAAIAPRLAARITDAAYDVAERVEAARDRAHSIASSLMFAEEDAAQWRRDLGIGEG